MAQLFAGLERQAAKLAPSWPEVRRRHGRKPLSELCCRGNGSVGALLGANDNFVLSAPNTGGTTMVDHQKTDKKSLSGSAPNWTEIFKLKPNLAPPGYEEACREARIYSSLKRAKQ